MKKTIFTLGLIVAAYILKAQVLYGTTSNEYNDKRGTICKLVIATNTLTAAFSFDAVDGSNPAYSKLLQASDGKLYGMTHSGGSHGGTIFSYDPSTSAYTQLKGFDYADGNSPSGSLIQTSDGKLYGMTSEGGSNGSGVIFSYDPATSIYTKLKDFDDANGRKPHGDLVQASNGKLYGMTTYGGDNDYGVIFSYDPATSAYTKLMDFDYTNGAYPYGSLIQAFDGKLYGMTGTGGSNNLYGVIFSYDPATSAYTKLMDFDGTNGATPTGSLAQASDGKLYGMTRYGGSNDVGAIFSYDFASSVYTKLVDFDYTNGAYSQGSFVQASNGKLYGTTGGGGSSYGVIFSYDPAASVYTQLKDFDGTDGSYPKGSLVQASDGNLYGMTSSGGSTKYYGVIFSYDPAASTYTKLRDFGTNNTGHYVRGGLIKDQSNKLFGMTSEGGSYGVGTIFSYNTNTSVFTKLKDFDNINGAYPQGSLVQASDGKLYGMTREGGTSDYGVMFSYDSATSTYTKLIDFDYYDANGAYPWGSLVQASDGKLYGMTREGGSSGYGVIFSYDPATWSYTKLKDFDYINGSGPFGSLVQVSDGKLYGMTDGGGSSGYGVIFSYDPATSAYVKLKDFDYTNGAYPFGGLVQASDGKLYGMTTFGGDNDYGVIFSYDPATSTYTKLVDFDNANGRHPYGTLVQVSDRNLYGMTYGGGSSDYGVAFSYDPGTLTYTKLNDFNGDNGSYPIYTSFTEIPCTTTTYYPDADSDGFGHVNDSVQLCEPQDGYVTDSTDCNDSNAAVYPGAIEICNGIDDNCNGEIDEGCTDVQISIADKSVIEGNQDRKFIAIPLTISEKPSKKIIRVKYTTRNNTARAGSDYMAQSGTLVFPPGLKKIILPIRITGDQTPEANETFRIILSDPVNATIADSTGIVTILDDDASASNAEQKNIKTICSITLSPNPAQDKVKIMITGYSGNVTIQLSGIDGRILQQQKLKIVSAKLMQQEMNVGSYANGTYLITAIDEKGNMQTKKLIIDR